MLVYKLFDKKGSLKDPDFRHMMVWGMSSISSGESPFIQCGSDRGIEEAKKQGFDLIAISAIPFSLPFAAVNVKIGTSGERVTVSGALRLEVVPDASFREYVLNRIPSREASDSDVIRDFNRSVNLDISPFLANLLNVEDKRHLELIARHGEEAFDKRELGELAKHLPSWCKMIGLQLQVDPSSATPSKYIAAIKAACTTCNKSDAEVTEKRNGVVRAYWSEMRSRIALTWSARLVDVLCHPLKNIGKLILLVIAAMVIYKGYTKVVEWTGGGKAHQVECKVVFEDGERSDSSKLEKWLFEQKLSEIINSCTHGRYKSFTYHETYKLDPSDVEAFKAKCLEYIRENRGTLTVKSKHSRRDGIEEVFEIGKHALKLVVCADQSFAPEKCRLVMEGKDAGGLIAQKMQRIFLAKGKPLDDGSVEYPITVRPHQLAVLKKHLENDRELIAALQLELDMPNRKEIRLYVNKDSTPREYTLDVSRLNGDRDLIVYVEEVFRCAFGTQTSLVRRYRDRQISDNLKRFGSDSKVICPRDDTNPSRLMFKVNLKLLLPQGSDLTGLSNDELMKRADTFWREEAPKAFAKFPQDAEALKARFAPYDRHLTNGFDEAETVLNRLIRDIADELVTIDRFLGACQEPWLRYSLAAPKDKNAKIGEVEDARKELEVLKRSVELGHKRVVTDKETHHNRLAFDKDIAAFNEQKVQMLKCFDIAIKYQKAQKTRFAQLARIETDMVTAKGTRVYSGITDFEERINEADKERLDRAPDENQVGPAVRKWCALYDQLFGETWVRKMIRTHQGKVAGVDAIIKQHATECAGEVMRRYERATIQKALAKGEEDAEKVSYNHTVEKDGKYPSGDERETAYLDRLRKGLETLKRARMRETQQRQ